MIIGKYISELLYRYQCVTVPGFGAFLTENQSAQLNGSAVSFLPPRKVISFNANIKNNDGLLANHVALAQKISYDAALDLIHDEVNAWLSVVYNRESLVLENIGTVKLSADMNWFFEPKSDLNYLTSSFGLSSFIAPAIKREELKKEVEVLEEKAPILFTPEKRKNYSFLKYAAMFAFFGLAGTFGYKLYYDQQIEQNTQIVQKNVEAKVQQKVQEATFNIIPPSTEPIVETVEKNTTLVYPYHIVAGVFSKPQNAENAYKDLVKKGFKAVKANRNKKGMYPVYYQSFATTTEAEQFLQNLRKDPKNQAWLLVE